MDQVHFLTSKCNLTATDRDIFVHGGWEKEEWQALCFDERKIKVHEF